MRIVASQITRNKTLFQQLVQATNKENTKVLHYRLRRAYQWPVNSPHKGPAIRKTFSCHDIMTHFPVYIYIYIDTLHFFSTEFYSMYLPYTDSFKQDNPEPRHNIHIHLSWSFSWWKETVACYFEPGFNINMGQVMKVRLSCYLVLISIDIKTR